MPRTQQIVKINSFSKGLITEANPLEFPSEASLDELNFIMDTDGVRRRRLGVDFEDNFSLLPSSLTTDNNPVESANSFNWENVGEDPNNNLIVVAIGNNLFFHNALADSISSSSNISSIVIDKFPEDANISLTAVDGFLVAVAGEYNIAIIKYNVLNNEMEISYKNLLIRDTFGVSDLYSGSDTNNEVIDLREGSYIQFRPKFKTDNHIYNLRNQSWGEQRRPHYERNNSYDPIVHFHTGSAYEHDDFQYSIPVEGANKGTPDDKSVLPSNSDIVHYGMAPDADDNPPSDNLYIQPFISDPIGNIEAPRGYFIIDALRRGISRFTEYKKLMSRDKKLEVDINTLKQDTTPKGASVVTMFAGRVFYAGFSGEIIDGDEYSPRLSGYVFFSRLVETLEDISKCYQEGDPTSENYSDVVDTDGGFVKIAGAYNIHNLVNLGDSLAVVAENGIWIISGSGLGEGFKATGFKVSKVSEFGSISQRAVIPLGGSLIYWGKDSIYSVNRSANGGFTSENLTENTIQTFYNKISSEDKRSCKGFFDGFERRIHWVYGGDKELVLDTKNGAFMPLSFKHSSVFISDIVEVPNFRIGFNSENITVGGVTVTVNNSNTTIVVDKKISGTRSIKYLTLVDKGNTYSYTFSLYKDSNFVDWYSYDLQGVDFEAYLIGGFLTGGDIQRSKTVNYITTHFRRTEDGVSPDGELLNQSSCILQGAWDWSSNYNSKQWSRPQQAYRLNRALFSTDSSYDSGYDTVVTKNKIRGSGKAVSILLKTEPRKDCRVLGLSMKVSVNANV